MAADIRLEYWRGFQEEGRELIEAISSLLVDRARGRSDAAARTTCLRAAHTLKGTAHLVGLEEMGEAAHSLETELAACFVDGPADLERIDRCLACARGLLRLLEGSLGDAEAASAEALTAALRASSPAKTSPPAQVSSHVGEPEEPVAAASAEGAILREPLPVSPAARAPAPAVPPALEDVPATARGSGAAPATERPREEGDEREAGLSVRVPLDRLDRLAAEVAAMGAHAAGLATLESRCRRIVETFHRSAAREDREERRLLFREALDELETLRGGLRDAALAAQTTIDSASAEVLSARLAPLRQVFDRLPAQVWQLARMLGKSCEVKLRGGDIPLDKVLHQPLFDMLLHLVRNTLDHGIEEPEERARRGKPASGVLSVSAATHGDRVVIAVEDDGRGIDLAKVRESARTRGRKPPRDLREALELIFEPGFSTQERTTAISGRGVGLDVVRTRARELKGDARATTEEGRGAAFHIELPLTLALSRLLLVAAGSETYALPMEAVAKVLLVSAASLEKLHGITLARDDGALVPLAPLAALVGREATPRSAEDELAVVILAGADRPTGLVVDEVLDAIRGTVRPLGVAAGRLCASATELADGRPVPVLSPSALHAEAREHWGRPPAGAPAAEGGRARVLVADDARTTRDILRHILETAGYDVTACEDGEEALAALERGTFAAIVSDVEMPRRGGIELTRAVRAHPRHARVPVILVTTLAAEKDRRRGLEAGASAYLTKSAFRQDGLLDTLARLLGEVSS